MPDDERAWPLGYGDAAGSAAGVGGGGEASGGAWLARLVEALPGAWFRFSREGRYLAAGGGFDGIAVRADQLVGRTLDDVVPGDVADRVRGGIATALRSGRAADVFEVERGGRTRIFDVVFAPAGADEVVALVQDSTARVAAERRVAASEQRLRAAVELANEGVWVLDAAGATSFATPRMAEILGCTLEDLLRRSPLEFMDAASRAVFAERQARRRRGEADPAMAFTLRTLDGRGVETTLAARPLYDDQGRYVGAVAVVSDETPQRRAERELAESQRRLGAVAEVLDDVFYVGEILADGSYQELFSGPGSARLLGAAASQVSGFGDAWDAAVHPADRAAYAAMNRRLAAGEAAELEYRVVGLDGVVRWVHDRARPRAKPGGGVVFDGVVSDISERRAQADALAAALAELRAAHAELGEAHAASQRLARTDALTGLFNRRHFEDALAAELARSERHRQRVGVVLIDIDQFKRVNDAHGHDAGDQVLQTIATRLSSATRPYDVVARWGGEEFIVLVAGIPDETALRRVGNHLIDAIRTGPVTVNGQPLDVTASAGAALHAGRRGSADALVDAADRALYAAKRRGRDRLVLQRDLTANDNAPEEPEAVRLAEGLAIAASIREAIPPLHCQQVADLAELVARQLGLTDTLILRCRLAGWLHDVGKLAIPDQILNRADTLNPDERQTLRRHPEIGAAILETLPSLRDAAAGVRHHHEHYDGTGYPDRLAGDQIPLEARIVAACDTYSAITAGRPYQPALDHDGALANLDHAAGKSLDPAIVNALKQALNTRPNRLP